MKANSFAAQPAGRSRAALLNVDLRPSVFELFLDRGGFFFVDAFFHRLRGAINQVLGFFQAQAGNFTNRLNHVDLVGAHFGENNGKLRLLLSRARCSRARTAARCHRRRRCCR